MSMTKCALSTPRFPSLRLALGEARDLLRQVFRPASRVRVPTVMEAEDSLHSEIGLPCVEGRTIEERFRHAA